MHAKIAYLQQRLAAYCDEAKSEQDVDEAIRLYALAIRCQEMITELEHAIAHAPRGERSSL